CTPPMRRKISFADFCYGVTSTAVVLQAKRLHAQHPAAYVRQLLILYHKDFSLSLFSAKKLTPSRHLCYII
ncbi:hypothetical protein, partial [Intestinimonas butyriciproducens]|uniref:hypothetical protein n=1 Tax=Intestinimonas butyriciproducens TaxID=1297617 RepID=UPI00195B558A